MALRLTRSGGSGQCTSLPGHMGDLFFSLFARSCTPIGAYLRGGSFSPSTLSLQYISKLVPVGSVHRIARRQ